LVDIKYGHLYSPSPVFIVSASATGIERNHTVQNVPARFTVLIFKIFRRPIMFCWLQFMRMALSHQPCERLLGNPRRQLIHEGPVTLLRKSYITVLLHCILFLSSYYLCNNNNINNNNNKVI